MDAPREPAVAAIPAARAPRAWVQRLRERLAELAEEPYRSGLAAVARKELAEHLGGPRFAILAGLVVLTSLASIYVAAATIRDAVGGGRLDQFVFLRLFTAEGESLPSFLYFLSFLAPLLGLTLGFDAVNAEEARRTLPRLLAQPIHRDAVINGKFLAGLATVALTLAALGLLVAGLGLRLIGVPPTGDEILRLLVFYGVTVLYVAFWLSLSILFSVVFRQASTSALAGMAAWLFLTLFWTLVAGLAADALVPLPAEPPPQLELRHAALETWLSRVSPAYLYREVTVTLLTPEVRALGPILITELEGALLDGALSLGQSLLLIWPQLLAMLGGTLALFCASYVLFMRREVRA